MNDTLQHSQFSESKFGSSRRLASGVWLLVVTTAMVAISMCGCGLAVIETNVAQAQLYRSRHGTNEWKPVKPLFRESFFIRDLQDSQALEYDSLEGKDDYPEAIMENPESEVPEGRLAGEKDYDSPPGKSQPASITQFNERRAPLKAPPLPRLAERIWVWRPFGGYAFIRAAQDGYLASPPKLIDFNRAGARWARLELQPSLEEEARRRLEAGQVYWRGRWVDPEVEGLVQAGGEWMTQEQLLRRERMEAGLVEFEGDWITPEQRDERIAQRRRADGLELYKGRFRTVGEISKLKEIALEMRSIRERSASADESTTGSAVIEISGLQPNQNLTILKLFNATGFSIEIIVEGADFIEGNVVPAYDEAVIEMPPGDYDIAAIPASPGLGDLYFGAANFIGQRRYTFVYNGNPPDVRNLDEVLAEETNSDIEAPTIEVPEMPERPEAEQQGRWPGAGGGGRGGGGRPR